MAWLELIIKDKSTEYQRKHAKLFSAFLRNGLNIDIFNDYLEGINNVILLVITANVLKENMFKSKSALNSVNHFGLNC